MLFRSVKPEEFTEEDEKYREELLKEGFKTWTKKDLISFEKEYNSFCANHPTLTYNPIYVKIQK